MSLANANTDADPKIGGIAEAMLSAGVILILLVLFLPIPAWLIDFGLSASCALSIVILMLALWIKRPIEFSSFPTLLLIATLLRLSLNIATTRLILSHGAEGTGAAGHIIGAFASLVMGGDFVIGLIVFVILVVVNFVVITKGATRIAEVGARFTLDAIPGKQMAIDADLSAGLIDDKEAQRRRRELEEESAFFGAMDGASKFVRGDAVAGLIILAVNIVGGMLTGVVRHGMPIGQAADVYIKLSVGDGLVTQIPALIVSLAAGLLVSKGGTHLSAQSAIFGQIGSHPRALQVAAVLMAVLGLMPGFPLLPFAILSALMITVAQNVSSLNRQMTQQSAVQAEVSPEIDSQQALRSELKTAQIEVVMGKQLASHIYAQHEEMHFRVSKARLKFAKEFGFIVPEVRLTDNLTLPMKSYQIRIHGSVVAEFELRLGQVMVIIGDGPKPSYPGDATKEPAYGMDAVWIPEVLAEDLKRENFRPVDNVSILLTHLSEAIRTNLSQLFSYRDLRAITDELEPEYKKLLEEICPSQISLSGIQGVLKGLLAERVSIRPLPLILEAIAEIVPHVRRLEKIVEHVRIRIGPQICSEHLENGVLHVIYLGNRWENLLQRTLKRDERGEIIQFDVDPQTLETLRNEISEVVKGAAKDHAKLALVVSSDIRPFIQMVLDRSMSWVPVLSHLEIARGVRVSTIGAVP